METNELNTFPPNNPILDDTVVLQVGKDVVLKLIISAQDEGDLRDLLTPQLSQENIRSLYTSPPIVMSFFVNGFNTLLINI